MITRKPLITFFDLIRNLVLLSRALFEPTYTELPNFEPKSLSKFASALGNRRLNDLRELVQDAANGHILFDQRFAIDTFRQLLDSEIELRARTRLVGFLTAPLGFLPIFGTPLQLAVQELLGKYLSSKAQTRFRWFYLLKEIAS